MAEETLEKLAAVIARLSQQPQQQAQAAAMPMAAGPAGFGLPQPMAPMAWQGGAQTPQPTGVSVPVSVPLPDGREVSMRVQFGPEAIGNLPALAQACAALFGQYLQTKEPWRRSSYGLSNGYGYRRRY